MNPTNKLFKPSSVGAAASLFTIVLLMMGNPFLVLTFFICVVYAVVPLSLWRKHRTWGWRASVIVSCALGFGIIGLGVVLEVAGMWRNDEFGMYLPGLASMKLALMAGIVFLPLACVGSIHSLVRAIRARRGSLR